MEVEVLRGEKLESKTEVLAYVFSLLLYPSILLTSGTTAFLLSQLNASNLYWIGPGVLTSLIPISAYVAKVNKDKGAATALKEDRKSLYTFSAALICLNFVLYFLLGSPPAFRNIFLMGGLGVAFFKYVNSRTKISVHSGGVAAAAGLNIFNHLMLVFVVLTAVVCWSRLELERHTVRQVVYGVLGGFALGVLTALIS